MVLNAYYSIYYQTKYMWGAPAYLDPLGWRALCSACSNRPIVPPVKLSTVDSRAFPVTAAQLWNNSLPDDVVLADSLSAFRRQLEHYLICDTLSGFSGAVAT